MASVEVNEDSVPLQLQDDGETTNPQEESILNQTQYFKDGHRKIDYVMVYNEYNRLATQNAAKERKRRRKRRRFEINLEDKGLELEKQFVKKPYGVQCFVKVHGPWDIMAKQAELLQIRMPIGAEQCLIKSSVTMNPVVDCCSNILGGCFKHLHVDEKYADSTVDDFTTPFVAQSASGFRPMHEKLFFTISDRSRMMYDILINTNYDKNRPDRIGIDRLVANGAYLAAYPLHEGNSAAGDQTERQLLAEGWANYKIFYKYQPLDLIRKYYGEKVSMYFAWTGFYTSILIPAALIGLICLLFGWVTLDSDYFTSAQICAANITMCPLCKNQSSNEQCGVWPLNRSCTYAKITHVFDNSATVIFAMFMSIWATLLLEYWVRYLAELQWKWDLFEYRFDEEGVRPEYESQARTRVWKYNPITGEEEPHIPTWEKVVRILSSGVTVLFFLCLVVAFVISVVVYRTIVYHVLNADIPSQSTWNFLHKYSKYITSTTSACLNLICIIILGKLYQKIARKLTEWEFPRTESEFENSYAFKVFLFQFINYYSSLFYIAFVKGRFHNLTIIASNEKSATKYEMEACDPAGCMVELVIQLAIIMVGKQFFSNFIEIFLPLIKTRWRRWRAKRSSAAKYSEEDLEDATHSHELPQWERDFTLNQVEKDYLFQEYLEIIIQYGFVTLFVAAFPLAPLFALINNVMEIRLDAYKFVKTYRRPQPERATDIGVWRTILDGLSWLAVFTNACVIAFTSDFIPRMYYIFTHGSFDGFVDWSLSYMDMSNVAHQGHGHEDICRYRDFRKPPCSINITSPCDCDDDYGYRIDWWYILAAKLAFVLVFEHTVFLVKGLVAYLIPDLPHKIFLKLCKESHLAKKARRDAELSKHE